MKSYDSLYRKRLTTPARAVKQIRNGDTVIHGMAAAEPPALLGAMADRLRAGNLKGIKIYSLFATPYVAKTVLAPDLADCVEAYAWFVSASNRNMVKVGLDYFVPNYFHQVPKICREYMNIDCTVTTVSPMDNFGYFSFGTANDFTSTAARHCRRLLVEVNRFMPRVFGESLLHVSEVDAIVENHIPLLEIPPCDAPPEVDMIGKQIAELVPDGATIQLGVGAIPNAVAYCLSGHKDLGIHTETFVSGMVDLIEKGIVTGCKKTLHPRKHVSTLTFATREVYDFMNDNPSIETYPVSHTNDPAIIAMNDNMISVNSVLEVDLLGQANAEYLGDAQYSGTGGQVDYVRGAFNAKGGKSFLAFYSTAKKQTVSRVVPRLKSGAVVTTSRMDVHYLVTEHGLVNLKGKSTKERALDIISLAHPKFRDDLLREAEDMYLL